MATNTQKKVIEFTLGDIRTEQFSTNENVFNIYKGGNVNLRTGFSFSYIEPQTIDVSMRVEFAFEKDSNLPFIIIAVSTTFIIADESMTEIIGDESESITLPVHFAQHLGAIVVGTTRGVLASKLESTKFSNFKVPLLHIQNFFSDGDLVINKS